MLRQGCHHWPGKGKYDARTQLEWEYQGCVDLSDDEGSLSAANRNGFALSFNQLSWMISRLKAQLHQSCHAIITPDRGFKMQL